jgi:thiamine biosynthesis protein ThiS
MSSIEPANLELIVNGEPREVARGETILGLLEASGLEPARVAVELDRRIIPKDQWRTTILSQGSQLEIVQFVGGG